jgi:predicted small metal-binding protein
MKKLSCVDLGKPDCSFVAEGETNEDVKMKIMEHVKMVHPEVLQSTNEEALTKMMDEKLMSGM